MAPNKSVTKAENAGCGIDSTICDCGNTPSGATLLTAATPATPPGAVPAASSTSTHSPTTTITTATDGTAAKTPCTTNVEDPSACNALKPTDANKAVFTDTSNGNSYTGPGCGSNGTPGAPCTQVFTATTAPDGKSTTYSPTVSQTDLANAANNLPGSPKFGPGMGAATSIPGGSAYSGGGSGTTTNDSAYAPGTNSTTQTDRTGATTVSTTNSSDHDTTSVTTDKTGAVVDGSSSAQLGDKKDDEKFSAADGRGSDKECSYSTGVSGKYGCGATNGIIETAKVTNVLGQTVGSVATAAAGQSAQQEAMAAGTQSAALHAAASTSRTSGEIQVGAGAVNGIAGVLQLQRMMHHNGLSSDFDAANKAKTTAGIEGNSKQGMVNGDAGYVSAAPNEQMANEIIEHYGDGGLNGQSTNMGRQDRNVPVECAGEVTGGDAKGTPLQFKAVTNTPQRAQHNQVCEAAVATRNEAWRQKQKDVQAGLRTVSFHASGEQTQMAQKAMAGGMMSLITGVSQAAAGGFAIAAANQLDQAANNLAAVEGMTGAVPGFTPLGATNMAQGDPTAGGNANSLNAGTTAPTSAAASTNNAPSDLGNLGTPLGTPQSNTPAGGPAPGAFAGGQPGGGSGGGGSGGGLGGASTGAAAADGGDPQAKMADSGRGAGYDSGSGVMSGGGGGGVGADKGPDLSGLLAQFLPKKDEDKPTNGILDFGSRNPASEGPISLLDRNANIFDRIHETYQDKNRRGRVGL